MLYIIGSIILLVIAIAATAFINNRPSSQTDIRAKASLQTGVVYEGIVTSVNASEGILVVENLTPEGNSSMILSGTWNVRIPSNTSLDRISAGVKVQLTVDSKTFDIQNKTMDAKKIEIK